MCLFVYIFAVFVAIKQKLWITFQFHWWGSSAAIFRALRVFHFDRGTSPEPFCVLSLLWSRERQDRARPRDGGDAYQRLCVWVWGCVLPLPWRRHYHRRTSLWSHHLQNFNMCGRTLVEGADSLSKWLQIILKVSICNRGYKNTEKADENCYNSVLTRTLATFIGFKMKTNNVPVCSLSRPVMSSMWQM